MTIVELRDTLNNEFGLHKNWPKTYKVNANTFAHVCQYILKHAELRAPLITHGYVTIAVGDNSGPMFKGVEILLKESVK